MPSLPWRRAGEQTLCTTKAFEASLCSACISQVTDVQHKDSEKIHTCTLEGVPAATFTVHNNVSLVIQQSIQCPPAVNALMCSHSFIEVFRNNWAAVSPNLHLTYEFLPWKLTRQYFLMSHNETLESLNFCCFRMARLSKFFNNTLGYCDLKETIAKVNHRQKNVQSLVLACSADNFIFLN